MPRKAKDKIDENEIIDEKKTKVKKSTTTKKADTTKKTKKAVQDKKTSAAKTTKKKETSKKSTTSAKSTTAKKTTATKKSADVKKTTTAKKPTVAKKSTSATKKDTEKKSSPAKKSSTSKTSTTKKSTAKKSTEAKDTSSKKATSTRKTSTAKKSSEKKSKKDKPVAEIAEYYDLPYKYGETVVRLLAQTPKTLFVYWEVSEKDIENFKNIYGDDFFNKTKPILIVHNLTLDKTTEIEINDFANCWYVNTEDSDCKFDIELARKFVTSPSNSDDNSKNNETVSIAKSNELQSPNNHILFEKIQEFVVFRNVNNENVIKKNIKSFKFLKDIYKFYKDMYDEEILNNPSSQFKF